MNRVLSLGIAVGATAAIGVGAVAVAAEATSATVTNRAASSYQLTSSDLTVGRGIGDTAIARGMCAADFHVRGTYKNDVAGNPRLHPTLTLNGDSDIYVKAATGVERNGGDSWNGSDWTYQGLHVTLGNKSWTKAKTANFTWTCDPNRR